MLVFSGIDCSNLLLMLRSIITQQQPEPSTQCSFLLIFAIRRFGGLLSWFPIEQIKNDLGENGTPEIR